MSLERIESLIAEGRHVEALAEVNVVLAHTRELSGEIGDLLPQVNPIGWNAGQKIDYLPIVVAIVPLLPECKTETEVAAVVHQVFVRHFASTYNAGQISKYEAGPISRYEKVGREIWAVWLKHNRGSAEDNCSTIAAPKQLEPQNPILPESLKRQTVVDKDTFPKYEVVSGKDAFATLEGNLEAAGVRLEPSFRSCTLRGPNGEYSDHLTRTHLILRNGVEIGHGTLTHSSEISWFIEDPSLEPIFVAYQQRVLRRRQGFNI